MAYAKQRTDYIMKKKKTGLILITAMAVFSLAACGMKEKGASAPQESGSAVSTESSESTENMASSEGMASQDIPQTTDDAEETPVMDELPEDRAMTSVSSDIKEFAENIQAAVAAEDMEALGDMSYYPLYVSFGEGEGEELESKEDFMALDSAKIFTKELKDAVAATDISTLEVFRAGVIVGSDDAIVFNEMSGKLMITSMYF